MTQLKWYGNFRHPVLGGCSTGQAKITQGYRLPAKSVIHTVGPIWRGGQHNEAHLLASCYTNSLKLALDNQLKTIAFPAISCGVYRYTTNG
ncbi:macro domain-containing protein [Candidatus Marithioploca araucensis]|uniref:Macro domain-containing protein n=1 Tax=Candidatus Marithioploca araucensis TaxID=70273 RepID=A0ABT7VSH6_9GAMM|nr:macro domain-containing protein [Candidatus Marithioploca araucensis]